MVTGRQHFDFLVDDLQKRLEWIDNAMAIVAEQEMRELAKRFPKRRLELHSGMGSTFLWITGEGRNDRWQYSGALAWHNWPDTLEVPCKGLWEAIERYQDEVSHGRDPGFGSIVYENGKRIEGTEAGGAIR